MKHINLTLPPRKYLVLFALTLLSIFIWQLGPHLLVARHYLLKEPQKRLALIVLLYLAWAIRYVFWQYLSPSKSDNQQITQMLHALRGRFLGAMRFLKKTMIDKHGYSTPLHNLPWYLLIGPPGSGKTTLLTNSNINFILSKQKKQEAQEKTLASSVCDWWITRDLVLVDVPGCYMFSPANDPVNNALSENTAPRTTHTHLLLWQSFLNLLIKYRQKNNIGALVISLPLPELLKQPRQQQAQWFQDLKQRLLECWAKFGKSPVYFIVTKCDLLPGFSEFFNDIGSDELMQPWGIPLSGRKEHEKLLDFFTERFNALTKRLNKQLIWRLHQERNPASRYLIKDFPLQLELLRENLIQLIKMLSAANPDLDLEGVYLVSATQENPAAASSTLFHHDLPASLEIPVASPFVSRPYFIKHFISYLLPHTSQTLAQRLRSKKSWFPQLAYGLGIALLFIATIFLGTDFQRSLTQLAKAQRYILQYQLYLQQNNSAGSTITTLSSALPLLNTLETATHARAATSRLEQMETPYSTRSQQTASEIYHKALQNIILPQVKNEFEKYLEGAKDKNPEQLYLALKAYLLLRSSSTMAANPAQTSFIIHTLEQISPAFNKKTWPKELAQPAFMQHLQNTLQLKQTASLNNKTINQARQYLNELSNTDLAYILVKDMGNNNTESELNFGTNIGTPPALISKGTVTQIPTMFTAQAFPVVMKDNLPLAAEQTVHGNAVLGSKFRQPDALVSDAEVVNDLTRQLEKIYINHYIDIWESQVDNISLNAPKNITETDAMIMNLISTRSPLLQLLQTIHDNTDIDLILSSSMKLQTLNTLFNQTQTQQKDSLYEIFINLRELHQYLQQSQQHSATPGMPAEANLQQAAANALLKDKQAQQNPMAQIRSIADKYPEPIKNWLLTLVSYTQNYLQPASKPKTSLKQAALGFTQSESMIILPAATLPVIQEPIIKAENQSFGLIQKHALNSYKKLPLVSKIKSGKHYSPYREAMKKVQEMQAKRAEDKAAPAVVGKGANGEYVKVLADNDHAMIFVQKD